MPNVLLDTVCTNKNYSYLMTAPSTTVNNPPKTELVQAVHTEDKSGSNKLLITGLVGLGVIGAAVLGVKGAKSLKNKNLSKEISDLRSAVKDKYMVAKTSMIEDFNKQKLPEVFSTGEFEGMQITSSKDIKKVKAFYQKYYENSRALQKETSVAVKGKLMKLSADDEWKTLRITRKKLLKDIEGNDAVRAEIAAKKIPLINDMLTYKLNPEEEHVFQVRNLISVDDARFMINKDFANVQEFDAEMQKRAKFGFECVEMDKFFVGNSKLSLFDVFREDYLLYEASADKAKLAKQILDDDIKPVEESFISKLKELASSFHKDKDVLKLKKLISSRQSA